MSLADEVFIRIDDAVIENSIGRIMKLLKPADIELLRLIEKLGPVTHEKARDALGGLTGKDVVTRCKARELVMPISKGSGHYSLEMTELGRQILEALDKPKNDES